MAAIRSRFVMVDGVKTHYSESGGNGPVIVACHGGGAGSSGLAGMGPIMREMPEDYRFIALDSVGGFGLTDAQAPTAYGLKARVEHLAAFVDALALDRFTMLGNSQGAWVAARYATLRPDRVERLVMIGSATISQAYGCALQVTDSMKTMFAFDGTRERMVGLCEGLVYDPSVITDELIEGRLASANRPGAMDSFALMQQGTRALQEEPILRQYFEIAPALSAFAEAKPTLVIWGSNDSFAPAELGRVVEEKLTAAQFEWVDRAGHQVQTDQPVITTRLLLDFMKQSTKLEPALVAA